MVLVSSIHIHLSGREWMLEAIGKWPVSDLLAEDALFNFVSEIYVISMFVGIISFLLLNK